MDTVTHAMSSFVIAAPLMSVAPITASAFIMGAVLPDLDALSRIFGKTAFIHCHQTYSHSLIGIAILPILFWFSLSGSIYFERWAPLALGLGMGMHITMDLTNTYGVSLLSPFMRCRICFRWVFFIDSIALLLTTLFLSITGYHLLHHKTPGIIIAMLYVTSLMIYWLGKWRLLCRAKKVCPAYYRIFIPSAWKPGHFFGYGIIDNQVHLAEIDSINGVLNNEQKHNTYDHLFASLLEKVTNYRIMRELSPGYHAVKVFENKEKITITCCDLCTRNFGGKFGQLEITFDNKGRILKEIFHV